MHCHLIIGIQRNQGGGRKGVPSYPINDMKHSLVTRGMMNRNFITKGMKPFRHVGSMLPHVESESECEGILSCSTCALVNVYPNVINDLFSRLLTSPIPILTF